MAAKGLFDPDLVSSALFDEAMVIEGWYDKELIDSASFTFLRLYLRNTTTNGISIGGVPCYDLLTTEGTSVDTAVVNTTAAGTEIQFTKTAGGSVAAFITGRVPVGGWTITSSDVALWLQESAATVNAGLRFRLFKYSGGTETEIGGSPFSSGTEFNTANILETLIGNVTDTALAENDRLLLRVYAVNVGTMAVGTATLSFNGATGGSSGQITVYPNGANGNVRFAVGSNTSWAAVRALSSSDPPTYPTNETVFQGENSEGTYIISRNGYVFDTSSIPDGATITSAVFSVYSSASGDGSETTNPANGSLVAYTPSSDTAPVAADYQQFGTTKLCDTDVTSATFRGAGGYHSWTLNATGLAAINKTGNTRLGIRPSNDFSDSTAPTARSYALGDFAAQTGTSQDPKLVVDYTTISFADSYINVYPIVAFKAESSGATGTVNYTNANDTSSATGTSTVTGTLARTNPNDTSVASGSPTITGSLARTNNNDTSVASGSPRVSGSLNTTNNNDSISAQGSPVVSGTLARTNANDTVVASGSPIVSGSLNRTNANDTVVATGTSVVTGTSTTTNSNDTSSTTGTPIITGASNYTNNDDSCAASGTVGGGGGTTGTVNYTNLNDGLSGNGAPVVSSTSNTTNANDSSTASGGSTVSGSSTTTNNNDISIASGIAGAITGTVSYTNNNDLITASGLVVSLGNSRAHKEEYRSIDWSIPFSYQIKETKEVIEEKKELVKSKKLQVKESLKFDPSDKFKELEYLTRDIEELERQIKELEDLYEKFKRKYRKEKKKKILQEVKEEIVEIPEIIYEVTEEDRKEIQEILFLIKLLDNI